MKTKPGRKKLEDLLRQMEHMEQSGKESGKLAYDFSWIRKELGMEREQGLYNDPEQRE